MVRWRRVMTLEGLWLIWGRNYPYSSHKDGQVLITYEHSPTTTFLHPLSPVTRRRCLDRTGSVTPSRPRIDQVTLSTKFPWELLLLWAGFLDLGFLPGWEVKSSWKSIKQCWCGVMLKSRRINVERHLGVVTVAILLEMFSPLGGFQTC